MVKEHPRGKAFVWPLRYSDTSCTKFVESYWVFTVCILCIKFCLQKSFDFHRVPTRGTMRSAPAYWYWLTDGHKQGGRKHGYRILLKLAHLYIKIITVRYFLYLLFYKKRRKKILIFTFENFPAKTPKFWVFSEFSTLLIVFHMLWLDFHMYW